MAKQMMRSSRKLQECSSARRSAATERHAKLMLAGVELVPDLTGALYVPDYRTLLVADLHLEKGSSFLSKGLYIPPYDTRATLAVLESALARLKPWRLVALGDSFHDTGAGKRIDAADLQRILAICDRVEMLWLTGNHDPDLPAGLGEFRVVVFAQDKSART